MKRLLTLLLAVLLLLGLAACREGETPEEGPSSAATMPTVLNQNEYVLYQNIFFNHQADDYIGKTAVKEGTYTRLYDAFSEKYRYYVWGYNDATKCCDWQWEFVPQDPESLPPPGSLVKLSGTLVRDEAALDKLWFTETELTLLTAYNGAACQVDMTTMDATLERVQLLNMQYKPEAFKGQTLRFYGRVLNPTTIQHPYYDNSWTQAIVTQAELPAIGTMVVVTGTWQGGSVQAGKVEPSSDF